MTGVGKAAWALLTALSALWALNHMVGAFVFAGDDIGPTLFVLLAIVGVVATIVLLGPYRKRHMWAWWLVTLQVAAIISVSLVTQPRVGVWYLTVGLLMAVAQLATLREFRGSRAELTA